MSFMMHPSRQNFVLVTAVAKGLGLKRTTVKVKWEHISYSWKMTNFNRGGPTGGYSERFARP